VIVRIVRVSALMLTASLSTTAAAQIAPNIQKPTAAARAAATAANERNTAAGATDAAAPQQSKTAPKQRVDVEARRDTSITSTIYREVFTYQAAGRRDPFVSLMATGELRPLLADLALISVIYDVDAPRRSVALLTDGSSGQTYRTTVGGTLGRMKVTRIGAQDITFSIEEYGLSRQQTLVIDHTPKKDAGAKSTTRRPQ